MAHRRSHLFFAVAVVMENIKHGKDRFNIKAECNNRSEVVLAGSLLGAGRQDIHARISMEPMESA